MTVSKPKAVLIAVVAISSYLVWLSFEPISYFATRTAWATLALLQFFCWSPVLFYRFASLLPVTITLWLLVMANFFITPILMSPASREYVSLPKNLHEQVKIVGDVLPGFSGVSDITTDEKGFRVNTHVDYGKKEAGTLRVVAIGASTTEQIYLDDKKTWTSLLAEGLSLDLGRKVEMINTGVSGLRAIHHHQTFEAVKRFDVDVALFLMGVNDWNKQLRETVSPPKRLSANDFLMDRSPLWLAGLRLRTLLSSAAAHGGPSLDDGSYYSKQNNSLERPQKKDVQITAVSADYQHWVGKIVDACKASAIRCVFIDQPSGYKSDISSELRRRLWMTPPDEPYTVSLANMQQVANTYNAWLLEQAKQAGIEVCDIAGDVPPSTDFFYDDCHFNENGSLRVATLLRHCLGAKPARGSAM